MVALLKICRSRWQDYLNQRHLQWLNLFCGCGVGPGTLVSCVWPSHLSSILSWKFFLMFSLVSKALSLFIIIYKSQGIWCVLLISMHFTIYKFSFTFSEQDLLLAKFVCLSTDWFYSNSMLAAQSIPLFETAFTRCTIVTILSYFWLRKSGHSIFGQTHVRKLLVSRALMGYLSLMSYVYW